MGKNLQFLNVILCTLLTLVAYRTSWGPSLDWLHTQMPLFSAFECFVSVHAEYPQVLVFFHVVCCLCTHKGISDYPIWHIGKNTTTHFCHIYKAQLNYTVITVLKSLVAVFELIIYSIFWPLKTSFSQYYLEHLLCEAISPLCLSPLH